MTATAELPLTFPAQLRKVQAAGEDFEWYPTTDEIITALKRDLSYQITGDYRRDSSHAFLDIGAGNGKVLTAAFQNSNLHVQFHPDFVHALNVQYGKLKGWLRNDAEAARELEIPIEIAAKHFQPGFRLTGSSFARLAPPVETEGAA